MQEVLDAADVTEDVVPSEADTAIEGVTLIGGKPIPLLDGHAVFSRYRATRKIDQALTCRIPTHSEWAKTILEPLVAAAGYRIAAEDEDVEADLAIALAEEMESPVGVARQVIRLRPDPDDAGDDTIYRYDRDALLAALKRIRTGRAA